MIVLLLCFLAVVFGDLSIINIAYFCSVGILKMKWENWIS